MNQSDIIFIICCIMIIAIAIVYSIMSVFIYKREQAIKNPYYFCDSTWKCCNTDNCDTNKSIEGVAKVDDVYFPSENWRPGSKYHQNCVLPVQNAILNYESTSNPVFNLAFLYTGGGQPDNLPSLYYPGCTGPGGEGKCADPTLNPQNHVSGSELGNEIPCPFVSVDSGGHTGNYNGLFNGAQGYSNGKTLTPDNWRGNSASPYIAGFNSSLTDASAIGNSYTFPYNTKNKASYKGQYTGGTASNGSGLSPGGQYNFYKSNTQLNTFYHLKNEPYDGNWTNPSL